MKQHIPAAFSSLGSEIKEVKASMRKKVGKRNSTNGLISCSRWPDISQKHMNISDSSS